jgi:hypothetical protein
VVCSTKIFIVHLQACFFRAMYAFSAVSGGALEEARGLHLGLHTQLPRLEMTVRNPRLKVLSITIGILCDDLRAMSFAEEHVERSESGLVDHC